MPCQRTGTKRTCKQKRIQSQRLPRAPRRFRMRCILERSGTKGQVHAGAANHRGIAALDGRDYAVGKIFRTEAARAIAASEPADAKCTGDTWYRIAFVR